MGRGVIVEFSDGKLFIYQNSSKLVNIRKLPSYQHLTSTASCLLYYKCVTCDTSL